MRLIHDLLNIIYPNLCNICSEALTRNEELICFRCRSDLPKIKNIDIYENELTDRFLGKFDISYLYFYKSGITQKLLHQLKYKNNPTLCDELGRWFGHELIKHNIDEHIDIIIPVPLHPRKKRKRGYNQSQHLAYGIAEAMSLKTNVKTLIRTHYQSSQTHKTKEKRWLSVEHAFNVIDEKSVVGKGILLVDDVVTTGATIEACANKLLNAGAKSIGIASLALAK